MNDNSINAVCKSWKYIVMGNENHNQQQEGFKLKEAYNRNGYTLIK